MFFDVGLVADLADGRQSGRMCSGRQSNADRVCLLHVRPGFAWPVSLSCMLAHACMGSNSFSCSIAVDTACLPLVWRCSLDPMHCHMGSKFSDAVHHPLAHSMPMVALHALVRECFNLRLALL